MKPDRSNFGSESPLAEFEGLLHLARAEKIPEVQVVDAVMEQIHQEEFASRYATKNATFALKSHTDGLWGRVDAGLRSGIWAAAASAALMLFSIWWGYSSLQFLSDPTGMWIRSPSLAWRAIDI
ncbi:hypothetical protein Plim_1256 [Planctopirus limnophila DSM 3776]|uniref:Uncharacterized protein n=1 Tax=Planctopirus limnophila (strain ATCC 43296 / DSM 3776 / IFAM 1008 / Mu 290) TaxID=521674 RepID=D5SUN8_PLAL2|nr:hypothetical protein [Planctopirus limnophila]ADG67090.1 hypothetical protein Plim_1256 [Planctopirus limnophila DSM 3776]